MKVTIEIEDALLAEVQALAMRQGVDLAAQVEKALRERVALLAHASAPQVGRVTSPLPVCSGKGGMHPWIDPCSNESMLDAMDDYP